MPIKPTNSSATVPHLVTIYVARRDLVPLLKRELLDGERDVKLEEAGILQDLFQAKRQKNPTMKVDSQGFTTVSQIESAQMISQPQAHRRVKELLRRNRGYLELKPSKTTTGALQVRLTEKGRAFAERFWTGYRELAASILAGVDLSQRQSHLSVNYAIQRKIHGLSLPWSAPPESSEPAQNVMSVFATAKAIRLAIERFVVRPEDGLSVERADLLVILYLNQPDFTSFGEIERSLVHSFSPSRHLISRWVCEMGSEGSGFLETRPLPGKKMSAALTENGTAKVEPIWERYRKLADTLMADVSKEDRIAHLLVNQRISDVIRPRIEDLVVGER